VSLFADTDLNFPGLDV